MKDLQSLEFEVVDSRTRPLVAEAVRAYEAGALRSATVSLWIAVVADLTYKIRHLAESGDGRARTVIEQLDRALQNQTVSRVQEYERNILDLVSAELDIIGSREVVELNRLNEDRNLCAHPAFASDNEIFRPDAESVRAHLVAASRSVFSQRPLAGRRIIETLQREIAGDSWPIGDSEQIRSYLNDRYFKRTRDSVQVNICRLLIKGSIKTVDGSKRNARRCREASYVIADDHPQRFETLLSAVLENWEDAGAFGDIELIRSVGAFGGFSVFWGVLPSTARSRLLAVVENCSLDDLVESRFFAGGRPVDPAVAAVFDTRLASLDRDQLRDSIRSTQNRDHFVDPAIGLVASSGKYRSAEANLRVLALCSAGMSSVQVAKLRDAIVSNKYDQVRLAGDAEDALIAIYHESPKSTKHIEEWQALAKDLRRLSDERDDEYKYSDLCLEVGLEES